MTSIAPEDRPLQQFEQLYARCAAIPTDFDRPPVSGYHFSRQFLSLRTGSAASGHPATSSTRFTKLLTVIAAAVGRMSRVDMVAIGTLRSSEPTQSGGCRPLHPVAIPIEIDLQLNLTSFQGQIDKAAQRALTWKDAVPGEFQTRLVPQTEAPALQLLFVLLDECHPFAPASITREDLAEAEAEIGQCDLVILARPDGDGLKLELRYKTDLFAEQTIRSWLDLLCCFWQAFDDTPDVPVGRLRIALVEDQLAEYQGPREHQQQGCVHDQFQLIASQHAKTVAVSNATEWIDYGDLDARSSKLAKALLAAEIREESLVAISMAPSVDLAIAILGVAKSGATYMLIDPRSPIPYQSRLVAESGAVMVIAATPLSSKLDASACPIETLDGLARLRNLTGDSPPVCVDVRNAAYVVYTSGSSGQPKGVVVEHGGLANLVRWHHRAYRVSPGEGVGQTSGVTFDAFIWEFWAALTSGATLHWIDPPVSVLPARLKRYVCDHELVVFFLSTRLLEQLLLNASAQMPTLRFLLTGGEKLHSLDNEHHPTVLVNHYGVTEATVVSTAAAVSDDHRWVDPPIGRPITNTQVYVLDKEMQLLPPGGLGEIYIGGEGVARGYLGNPRLTAESFVPNPFSKLPGRRLYRTGDLGRFRVDGNLEYIGRVDRQVQLRGIRVDPEGVESTLLSHPKVSQAVVIPLPRSTRPDRLVAYVAPRAGDLCEQELHQFIDEHLPPAIRPSEVILMESIPRTDHGKADYSQLAELASSKVSVQPAIADRTEHESVLAEVWRDVLNLDNVRIDDNFFQLGGDSILAIQCVSRARDRGVHFRADQLMKHPTIAGIAKVARRCGRSAEPRSFIGPAPLSPVQHWFVESGWLALNHFVQVREFDVRLSFSSQQWKSAMAELVRSHDALRLKLDQDSTPYQQHVVDLDPRLVFIDHDLRELSASEVENRIDQIKAELREQIDLSSGQLIRAARVRSDHRDDRFVLIIHHFVMDYVSWRILVENLQSLLKHGDASRNALRTGSFCDWAVATSDRAAAGVDHPELEFWLDQLPEAEAMLPRDLGEPGEPCLGEHQRTLSIELDQSLTARLQSVSFDGRPAILASLAAGTVAALSNWAERPRICLELEGHGRHANWCDIDFTRTVGWFTAGFPFLVNRADGQTMEQLARTIHRQWLTVPQGGLAYGILRHALPGSDVARLLATRLSPEVRLNYLGRLDQAFPSSGFMQVRDFSAAPLRGPEDIRPHLFEIDAYILDKKLNLEWTYGADAHRTVTVQRIVGDLVSALEELAGSGLRESANSSLTSVGDVMLSESEFSELSRELRRWNG